MRQRVRCVAGRSAATGAMRRWPRCGVGRDAALAEMRRWLKKSQLRTICPMPARRTEGRGSHTVSKMATTSTIMVICGLMCVMRSLFEAVPFVRNVHFFRQRAIRGAATQTGGVPDGIPNRHPDGIPNRQIAKQACRYGTEWRIRPHAACEHASCKKGARSAASSPRPERPSISAGRPLARRGHYSRSTALGSHPASVVIQLR